MKTEFGQKRKNNKKQTMAILMAGAYCFGRFCVLLIGKRNCDACSLLYM